jgi:hypothetical protein
MKMALKFSINQSDKWRNSWQALLFGGLVGGPQQSSSYNRRQLLKVPVAGCENVSPGTIMLIGSQLSKLKAPNGA